MSEFGPYLYCAYYDCETSPVGYWSCDCPGVYDLNDEYFSYFYGLSQTVLDDIFGTPFVSNSSSTFTMDQPKQEFGCLVSVKDDITINGATTFSIPQAKMIAKAATDERRGNFLGLGRPVAETPYSNYFSESTSQASIDLNDYNIAYYEFSLQEVFSSEPILEEQKVGFGYPRNDFGFTSATVAEETFE